MSRRASSQGIGRPSSQARRHFLALAATGAGLALTLIPSTSIAKNVQQSSSGKGALLDQVLGSDNGKGKGGAGGNSNGSGNNSGGNGNGNAYGQGGGSGGGPGSSNAGGNGNGNAYGLGGGSVAGAGGNGAGPFCFLKGTQILTANGEVCVEDLRVGDRIVTVDGREVPVRWIDRRTVSDENMPIRISRFALDDHSPHCDLYVSPAHALLIDGYLMPAKDLVNGISITPALPDDVDTIDYYHLVLETHEVILADGAAAETLLISMGREHEALRKDIGYAGYLADRRSAPMTPYAPNIGYEGGRDHLKALLRLGMSRFVDVRDPLQRAYDRLAERCAALDERDLALCGSVEPTTGQRST